MLKITHLRFTRDEETIVPTIDLGVDEGVVLIIRGSNGSGKTTVLRIIGGMIEPDEGMRFSYRGSDSGARNPQFQEDLMFVGHHLGLKADLSALENLQFYDDFAGDGRMTPREALHAVGLAGHGHAPARRLSAGQKKRLALGRLLLNRRKLWLLDEPYSNLDRQGIALVDELLDGHARDHGAAIVTSHGTFVPQVPVLEEILL